MTKNEWVAIASAKLEQHMASGSREYAEALYETYVENDKDSLWIDSPEDAVAEDITYWN